MSLTFMPAGFVLASALALALAAGGAETHRATFAVAPTLIKKAPAVSRRKSDRPHFKTDSNTVGLYADVTVERGQKSGESWSFPAGTFPVACGQLTWNITGLPADTSGTFSPVTTTLSGSTTLSIVTSATSPFGVSTFDIAATCTTSSGGGGTSQTLGIFEYPPDPTAQTGSINVAAGQTGTYHLSDTATADFSPLTWQAWGAPGALTFGSASTTGPPYTNVLSVSVPTQASPGGYALSADVVSASSYGESSPVTLYLTVTTPSPSTPTPMPTASPPPLPPPAPLHTLPPSSPFSSVIQQLRAITSIPIYLPSTLPADDGTLYADVLSVTATQYVVEFSPVPNCQGTQACAFGFIAGFAHSDPDLPPETGIKVKLRTGAPAYFTGTSCGGAGCTGSSLLFDKNGYRYSVGSKASGLSDVTSLADAVLQY